MAFVGTTLDQSSRDVALRRIAMKEDDDDEDDDWGLHPAMST